MRFSAPKGTRDILSPEVDKWALIESRARQIFSNYGFKEIRTPVFEPAELFTRSIGEVTDIVTKEMYLFEDKKGRPLALRPENTAGVIRAYLENGLAPESVHKLFYIGPMFRYERPQAGRYRQFHQIGAEIVGSGSPLSDAETILLNIDLFSSLGIGGLKVRINTIGCSACRDNFTKAVVGYLSGKKDLLCGNCRIRMEKNPLRVFDCKVPSCREVIKGAPGTMDSACGKCKDAYNAVFSAVEKNIKPYSIEYDKYLVRGLDYYTGTVFEIVSSALGAQDTLSAGGRYDNLVEELGGPKVPACGFAFGEERCSLILSGDFPENYHLGVAALEEKYCETAFDMVYSLRKNGFKVYFDNKSGKLKNFLSKASRLNIAFTAIIGENEFIKKTVLIKNMRENSQEEVGLDSVLAYLSGKKQGGRF